MLIPELFLASGMAMGINPCLAPGDMIVSPNIHSKIFGNKQQHTCD